MANLLLAICLTVATVNYQRPSALFCGERLSAGFPVAFICDASGESPVSSWGKIDWADVDSINPPGSFVDILFYVVLSWTTWLIVGRISHVAGRRNHPQ